MGDTGLLKINRFISCRISRRINRFVVETYIGSVITRAYINNTGRLYEYLARGKKGFCIKPSRISKIPFRLIAVEDRDYAALIDTRIQMRAFEIAVKNHLLPRFSGCNILSRNPHLGESVLDYLLLCGDKKVYVETKSAVLRGDTFYAMYPDCPTLRGRRHIRDLIRYAENNGLSAIVFIAALPEVEAFKPYALGDPEIPVLLREAVSKGVIVTAFSIYFDPRNGHVMLDRPELPVLIHD